MTEIQNGLGATPEQLKKSKYETIETIQAGVVAQRNVWPDIVALMLDRGMLLAEQGYAWDGFCRLKAWKENSGTSSGGGDGWKEMEWQRFQKILGHFHLRVLNELWEYPVPQGAAMEKDITWRLNRCMHLVRDALFAAVGAAQQARKEIEGKKDSIVSQ